MTVYVCETCAAHYEAGAGPPEACLICRDDRQYVGTGGDGMQRWITQEELFRSGHRNVITPVKHGVFTIGMHPQLGIGQVAHLLQRPSGNVLWDCVCLAPASVPDIRRLGGVHKVVISHPHFYTACCFWAETFGCAVFVHARDRAFVTQPCPAIRVWADDALRVGPGLTAHRLGGHFPGSCVMLDEGDGTLYSGAHPRGRDRGGKGWEGEAMSVGRGGKGRPRGLGRQGKMAPPPPGLQSWQAACQPSSVAGGVARQDRAPLVRAVRTKPRFKPLPRRPCAQGTR